MSLAALIAGVAPAAAALTLAPPPGASTTSLAWVELGKASYVGYSPAPDTPSGGWSTATMSTPTARGSWSGWPVRRCLAGWWSRTCIRIPRAPPGDAGGRSPSSAG
jgi:hypothetical protein